MWAAEGYDRFAAAFEEHSGFPVCQENIRAGGSGWPASRLGPPQSRTIGLSRVGGSKQQPPVIFIYASVATERIAWGKGIFTYLSAMVSKAVDGSWEGKLSCPKARHEVAATNLALFFESLEHGVHPGEATLMTFGQDSLSGHHAVALEQLTGPGVGGKGGFGLVPVE
jgi:hypothetical protein